MSASKTTTPNSSCHSGNSVNSSATMSHQEIGKLKSKIHEFSKLLHEEVIDFIDQQIKINKQGELPRLPIFFVKGFNLLKWKTNEMKYDDEYLNLLPNSIERKWLIEFGPSPTHPKLDENGFLTEEHQSVVTEIQKLCGDAALYVLSRYCLEDRLPSLPTSFYLALRSIQIKIDSEKEFLSMMVAIQQEMQSALTTLIGERNIDKDYIRRCFDDYYARWETY